MQKTFKTEDGYDFSILSNAWKHVFDNSDYAVANLETPIAGEKLQYIVVPIKYL